MEVSNLSVTSSISINFFMLIIFCLVLISCLLLISLFTPDYVFIYLFYFLHFINRCGQSTEIVSQLKTVLYSLGCCYHLGHISILVHRTIRKHCFIPSQRKTTTIINTRLKVHNDEQIN